MRPGPLEWWMYGLGRYGTTSGTSMRGSGRLWDHNRALVSPIMEGPPSRTGRSASAATLRLHGAAGERGARDVKRGGGRDGVRLAQRAAGLGRGAEAGLSRWRRGPAP